MKTQEKQEKPTGHRLETDWKPIGNRLETDQKPIGNPLETYQKPIGNLLETCPKMENGKKLQKPSRNGLQWVNVWQNQFCCDPNGKPPRNLPFPWQKCNFVTKTQAKSIPL